MGLLSTQIYSATINNLGGFLQNKEDWGTIFIQAPAFILNFEQGNSLDGELFQLSLLTA